MSTDFPFVQLPPRSERLFGKRQGDARIYLREGSYEECGKWFEELQEHFGQIVSPGGASMFVRASRASVYKRIQQGGLTLFQFQPTHYEKMLFGKGRLIKEEPYAYIVVSECKAWAQEMEERYDRLQAKKEEK